MTSERPTLESVMPLVHYLARKYHRVCRGSIELDDLVQVGSVAVFEALKRFDPERGPFAAFAAICVRGRIRAYIDEHVSAVRVSRHAQEKARKLGMSARMKGYSLDAPRGSDDPDSTNWVEFVVAETEEASPALTSSIIAAIDRLPPRLRKVLLERYFGERGHASLGKELGVGSKRVSQLETRALELLRKLVKREAGREWSELTRGGERP